MCEAASSDDASEMKIVRRGRGKVLLFEGFQYYFHAKYENGNCIWRCKNFKKPEKCTGTVTVKQGPVSMMKVKSSIHLKTCMPNENENTVSSIISSSIETAASSVEETIPAMYKKTLSSMRNKGLDLIQKLPNYNQYRCMAYRRKRKLAKVEKMAYTDMKEVEVPPDYDDFLLADYQQDSDRILVFALEEARAVLKNGKVFLGDGTFKCCPKPFTQLYVLFCDLGSSENKNNVVPVIYALMPNKVKNSYVVLLELIKSAVPEWEPTKFITDFEQAAISAIKCVFPNIEHHGCYFHFKDRLTRKAKKLNIQTKNKKNNDTNLNKIIGLCIVLPLLPERDIEKGWNYVLAESQVIGPHPKLGPFLSYIQRYWMPKTAMWCCFGERHRTNNVCEGWNGQFNKSFKRRPTTIAHLLKMLKQDAAFTAVNAATTEPFKIRTKPVIERSAYIHHVQMQLVNGEIDVPLFLEKLRR